MQTTLKMILAIMILVAILQVPKEVDGAAMPAWAEYVSRIKRQVTTPDPTLTTTVAPTTTTVATTTLSSHPLLNLLLSQHIRFQQNLQQILNGQPNQRNNNDSSEHNDTEKALKKYQEQ